GLPRHALDDGERRVIKTGRLTQADVDPSAAALPQRHDAERILVDFLQHRQRFWRRGIVARAIHHLPVRKRVPKRSPPPRPAGTLLPEEVLPGEAFKDV